MLHASQPWLPLLDPGPQAGPEPGPAATRRPRAAGRTRTAAAVAMPTPIPALAPAPALQPAAALDPDGFDAAEVRSLRFAFLGLAEGWDLSARDALALFGEPLEGEAERLQRLRALAGVRRLLLLLHPERERTQAFLRAPCPALDGEAPLGLMLAGGQPAIVRVRAHLAALAGY